MMAKLEIKKLHRWSPIKGRAERQKARNKRIDIKDIGHVILFLAAFLGVWHIVFIIGIFPKVSLPSPAMVAQSFADLLFNGSLVMSIGMTMWRLVAGFSISIYPGCRNWIANGKVQGLWQNYELICRGFTVIP